MSWRSVSKKEFDEFVKYTRDRFGDVSITNNADGTKTVMIISRNKHAGTFKIREE